MASPSKLSSIPSHPIPPTLDHYLASSPDFKSFDRVESLYSDFSSARHSNPAGFDANNAAWLSVLNDVLRFGLQPPSLPNLPPDRLILHFNDSLLDSFRRPGIGKPYGLCCPVWNLSSLSNSSSPTFVPLATFLSSPISLGPSPGIAATMVRSISWASRTLIGGSLFDPDQRFDQLDLDQKLATVKIDWVNLSLLREAADQVIERYQQNFIGLSPQIDCLFTHAQFKDQLTQELFPSANPATELSSADLNVLLKHLERDRNVLIYEAEIIKFVLPHMIECDRCGRRSSKTAPPPINQTDRGILSVKRTIQHLTQQIQAIGIQIDQRTADAKKYLQNSQKQLAASHLKSRKLLQEVLNRRLGTLDTLQTVYMKIEQASTDVEIMAAYQTSTQTLKTILSTPSLQLDNIDQTMDSLHDVLADQKDIDQAIDSVADTSFDEQELAAELASLTAAEPQPSMVDALEGQLKKLSVPDTSPEHPLSDVTANKTAETREGAQVAL